MITFNAVLKGRIPCSQLNVEVKWANPGLAEIFLINAGELDEAMPMKIATTWVAPESPQTMDGLSGYVAAFDPSRRDSMVLAAGAALAGQVIAPGRVRKIAWMRFAHEIPLVPQIIATP